MEGQKRAFIVLALFALLSCLVVPSQVLADEHETVQWINHLEFVPGVSYVATSYTPINGGLKVTATETGENFIVQGVQVAPGVLVSGIRVCYELTDDDINDDQSLINDIVITQLQAQDPPASRTVVLNDTTALSEVGPICVNSLPSFDDIDPSQGALNLSLGMWFPNLNDSITVLGVGLLTVPDPNAPMALALKELQDDVEQLNSNQERIINVLNEQNTDIDDLERDLDRLTNAVKTHTHVYMTGRGRGHNNTEATTSTFILGSETPTPTPTSKVEPESEVKEIPAAKKAPVVKVKKWKKGASGDSGN